MEMLTIGMCAVGAIGLGAFLVNISSSNSTLLTWANSITEAIKGLKDNQKVHLELTKAHQDAINDLQKSVAVLKPAAPVVKEAAKEPLAKAVETAKETNGTKPGTAKPENPTGKASGNGK